jgi:hypothetical protein
MNPEGRLKAVKEFLQKRIDRELFSGASVLFGRGGKNRWKFKRARSRLIPKYRSAGRKLDSQGLSRLFN